MCRYRFTYFYSILAGDHSGRSYHSGWARTPAARQNCSASAMQCRQSHFHSAGPPSPASACTASIPMSSDVSRRQNIESGPSARTSSSPRTAKYPPPSMHNPHAHQPLHLPFRTRPPPKLDQQPEHVPERMLVRLADAHQLVSLGVDLERRLEHLLHQLRRVEDNWRRRREAGVAALRPVPPVALVEPANARRAEDVDHEGTPHAAQTPWRQGGGVGGGTVSPFCLICPACPRAVARGQ